MSLENAHKLIRIYMGGLILGVNALYRLSCFLKLFDLVGKELTDNWIWPIADTALELHFSIRHSTAAITTNNQ